MPLLLFLLIMLLAGLAAFLLSGLLLALFLLRPPRMTDGKAMYLLRRLTPLDLGLAFTPHRFEVRDARTGRNLTMAAWWIPASAATPARGCAILIHGRADAKVGAIAWAPFLHRLGLHILAVDLRGHGESAGRDYTGGYFERDDLDQIIDQVQVQYPGQANRPILIGLSSGSAAALAVAAKRDDVAGVIADSMFESYRQATWEHLRLLGFDFRPLHRLAIAFAQRLSGANYDEVAPVNLLGKVNCPILAIDGAEDPLLPPTARAALDAAFAQRSAGGLASERWKVVGAGHLQAYAREPLEYERRIEKWIAEL